MDIGSILLILSFVILTALFVLRPFCTRTHTVTVTSDQSEEEFRQLDQQISALLAEKDRLLTTLQELETDAGMGKIPEEDFPAQRASLLAAGADVLRQIDELEAEMERISGFGEPQPLESEPLPEDLPPVITGVSDPIEEMVSARRQLREEKSAGFCPKCGKVIQKSDVFCPRCGSQVALKDGRTNV